VLLILLVHALLLLLLLLAAASFLQCLPAGEHQTLGFITSISIFIFTI